MFVISTLPFLESAIDFATISCITALLLLSFFSFCFIFHLRFKSRSCRHLQNFNSLWTVRFLFVFFIVFWALTELLRLPFLRRRYFYPLLPTLTVPQEANLCKVHLVLSLGLFEPGFLITLLFLLDVSVKKTSPRSFLSVFFVLALCLPILLLQVYVVFYPGSEIRFPEVFQRSWFVRRSSHNHTTTVLCTYPLLSTILFGIFGAVFWLSFLVSFWRLVSHVINKGLRVRIYALAFTVVIALSLQTLLMGLSVFWTPDETAFDGVALVVFLSTFTCAVVGEGILVIKPIADSLAAGRGEGGDSSQGSSHRESSSLQPPPVVDGDVNV